MLDTVMLPHGGVQVLFYTYFFYKLFHPKSFDVLTLI